MGTRATYNNARHMNVQHPLSGIVRPVNLYEVGLEVVGDGLVFVRSLAVRRDAVKAVYPCQLVPGNMKQMGALFRNSGALGQFLLQQIGFIYNPRRFDGIKRNRGVTHSGRVRGGRSSTACSRISARKAGWNPLSYSSKGPLLGTKRGRGGGL